MTAATATKTKEPKTQKARAIKVNLADLDPQLRPASQMRVALSPEAVESYAGRLDELPPIKLVRDYKTGAYWLADGCHTVTAARRAGRKALRAVVIDGNYLDAFKEAARANDTHGVRVSNADKRHRVEQALACPDLADWSNRRIAEFIGVSHQFVNQVRPELSNTDVATVATSPASVAPGNGPLEGTSPVREDEESADPEVRPDNTDVATVATSPETPKPARPDPAPTRVDSLGRRQPANRPKSSRKVVVDEYAQDVPDIEDQSQDEDARPVRDSDDSEGAEPLPQRPPVRVLPKSLGPAYGGAANPAPTAPGSAPLANPVPMPKEADGGPALVAVLEGIDRDSARLEAALGAEFVRLDADAKRHATALIERIADRFDGWSQMLQVGTD